MGVSPFLVHASFVRKCTYTYTDISQLVTCPKTSFNRVELR
jgi:hypothetical protein